MNKWIHELLGLNTNLISEDTFSEPISYDILKRQDIDRLKSLFEKYQDNWNYRYFYSLAMSRHFPINKIRDWAEQDPNSSDAYLLYGARMLKESWNARGYGRGRQISKERWRDFYELLDQTENILLRAAQLNESDPTPWVYLIMVAVYRSKNELEDRYFNEAISRDPQNWHAHMSRLTGLSEKYGGSHSEMFKFAREARHNLPDGSLLHCLVLKAHSEYWKYKYAFEDNDDYAESYRNNQGAISECLDAYNMSLADCNLDLIDSIFVRINAAGTFYIFRQKAPLRKELHVLGKALQDIHWRWVGIEGQLADAKRLVNS